MVLDEAEFRATCVQEPFLGRFGPPDAYGRAACHAALIEGPG
jgi:hypothetical protein